MILQRTLPCGPWAVDSLIANPRQTLYVSRTMEPSVKTLRLVRLLFLLPVACCSAGCNLSAYSTDPLNWLDLALGQLEYLKAAVPIEQLLADPDLPQDLRERLELAVDARRFAVEQGLSDGPSYRTYVDTLGLPAAWNVTASPRTALFALSFLYPFAGSFPYAGFFDRADAEAFAEGFRAEGFDAHVAGAAAYSTLGIFPDPVYSSMLEGSRAFLVETILHEKMHETIFAADRAYNEALASYAGRYGSLLYFETRFADRPEVLQRVRGEFADRDVWESLTAFLRTEMDAYYTAARAAGLSEAQILAGRDGAWTGALQRVEQEFLPRFEFPNDWRGVLSWELNNARSLYWELYNSRYELFDAVRVKAGGTLASALPVFRAAGEAADPFAWLETWMAARAAD